MVLENEDEAENEEDVLRLCLERNEVPSFVAEKQ